VRAELIRLVQSMRKHLDAGARGADVPGPEDLVRTVRTRNAAYRLSGALLGGVVSAERTAVLVSVERLTPELPPLRPCASGLA
jgi:hypothetical protein